MGTITTYEYCLAKCGRAYTGTKEQIVAEACQAHLDKDRMITLVVPGFEAERLVELSSEFSLEEARREIVNYAFSRLVSVYGYRVYRDIGR